MSEEEADETWDMELDEDREDAGEDLEEEDEDSYLGEGEDIDGTWPDKETTIIIDMYRSSTLLYDVSHPSYANRDKKLATLKRMANQLHCSRK